MTKMELFINPRAEPASAKQRTSLAGKTKHPRWARGISEELSYSSWTRSLCIRPLSCARICDLHVCRCMRYVTRAPCSKSVGSARTCIIFSVYQCIYIYICVCAPLDTMYICFCALRAKCRWMWLRQIFTELKSHSAFFVCMRSSWSEEIRALVLFSAAPLNDIHMLRIKGIDSINMHMCDC